MGGKVIECFSPPFLDGESFVKGSDYSQTKRRLLKKHLIIKTKLKMTFTKSKKYGKLKNY